MSRRAGSKPSPRPAELNTASPATPAKRGDLLAMIGRTGRDPLRLPLPGNEPDAAPPERWGEARAEEDVPAILLYGDPAADRTPAAARPILGAAPRARAGGHP